MYRIMLVEDQKEIREIVSKYILKEGFECLEAEDGFQALELFNRKQVHLVILDVMMPGIDGFEVLTEIRRISEVPVIMLTARQEEVDRVKGFRIGADDYVLKPFSPKELILRTKRLLKRIYGEGEELIYQCGKLSLHTSSRTLYHDQTEIPLTSAEYGLLEALFRNRGQVLTREQLIEMAYGPDYEGYDRNIDSYIKRIRQKIEEDPKSPVYLKTRYGAGYVFGGACDDH